MKDLDELTGPETVIASNSSSYTISEIVTGLPLKHAERMASLHSCEYGVCTRKERLYTETWLHRLAPGNTWYLVPISDAERVIDANLFSAQT